MALIETIELVPLGPEIVLQSSNESLNKIKRRALGSELEDLMKEPLVDGGDSLHDLLTNGLVELCKVKPVGLNAVEWLGEWLLANNPNKPRVEIPDDE